MIEPGSVKILIVGMAISLSFSIGAAPHLFITAPSASDVFQVGDTLHFRFSVDSTFLSDHPGGLIRLSFNNGHEYFDVYGANGYGPSDSNWGDFFWVVTDTLLTTDERSNAIKTYTISDSVRIMIDDMYGVDPQIYISALFRIQMETAADLRPVSTPTLFQIVPNPSTGLFRINGVADEIKLFTLSGRHIGDWRSGNRRSQIIDMHSLPAGIYLGRVAINEKETVTRKFILQK